MNRDKFVQHRGKRMGIRRYSRVNLSLWVFNVLIAIVFLSLLYIGNEAPQELATGNEAAQVLLSGEKSVSSLLVEHPMPGSFDVALDLRQYDLNQIEIAQVSKRREDHLSLYTGAVVDGDFSEKFIKDELPGIKEILLKSQTLLPWASTTSLLYGGAESLCGAGGSFDALQLYNPLLLVEARFWGLSIWNRPL